MTCPDFGSLVLIDINLGTLSVQEFAGSNGLRLSSVDGNVVGVTFESVSCEFRCQFRFEARIRGVGFDPLLVRHHLGEGLAISPENLPIMSLFFHFVAFGSDSLGLLLGLLRFEPNLSLALVGLKFHEVVQGFVEGARVGGLIAHILR